MLIFIIIINLLLISSVIPLNTDEINALTDMYNEWGTTLKWTLPVSGACSWHYITCVNEHVADMLLNLFIY